jgi:hypothetical protein
MAASPPRRRARPTRLSQLEFERVRGFTPKPAKQTPLRSRAAASPLKSPVPVKRGPGESLEVYREKQNGKVLYFYEDTDELADTSTPGLYMRNPLNFAKGFVDIKTGYPYFPQGFLPLSRPFDEDRVADSPAALRPDEASDEESDEEDEPINPDDVTCETLEDYIGKFPILQNMGPAGLVTDPFTQEHKDAFKVLADMATAYTHSECDGCDLNLFLRRFLGHLRAVRSGMSESFENPSHLVHMLKEPESIATCSAACLNEVHTKIVALLSDNTIKLQLLQLASMEPITKNIAIVSMFAIVLFFISCNSWDHVNGSRKRIAEIVNMPLVTNA